MGRSINRPLKYDDKLKRDIIAWDITNWWKFIELIESHKMNLEEKKVLEIGARGGGLSLYFALNKADVVCSDIVEIPIETKELHNSYGVSDRITYAKIDATKISEKYNNYFDIVVFKSVLGGVGSYNNIERQCIMIDNIQRVLNKNGLCIFAENMRASALHKWARETFRKIGKTWHYETRMEIYDLFSDFKLIDEKYCGFLGCFGRNERQREFLGSIDSFIMDRMVSESKRYIGIYFFAINKGTI